MNCNNYKGLSLGFFILFISVLFYILAAHKHQVIPQQMTEDMNFSVV